MKSIKLGVIREGKVPPDFRVPLTPKQCKAIEVLYPEVKVVVQRSPIRTYPDASYAEQGIELVDSLEDCDYIFGVKEVQIADLIPNKTFFFFSHTFKKQPYNRDLLNAVLDKKIRLVDYEVLKDKYSAERAFIFIIDWDEVLDEKLVQEIQELDFKTLADYETEV